MSDIASLRCLIYSHAWCVELLESQSLLHERSLLVELAQDSHLASIYNRHGESQPGLLPLLPPPKRRVWHLFSTPAPTLERLLRPAWTHYEGLSSPLVLAAYPVLAQSALESAVTLLSQTPSHFDEILLLAHVSDVPRLNNMFAYVEHFSVLWDVADLPSPALPDMAETLVQNGHLNPTRWGGFHLCNHPARKLADEKDRWEAWQRMLAEYPMLPGGRG